jgi:hypothetical protein
MSTENTAPEDTSTEQSAEQREAAFAEGYDDDNPTETPGDEDEAEATAERASDAEAEQPPAEPEYVQLTRQQLEELQTRAALIEQIKTTQDKGFGTMGGTIREIRQQIEAIKGGKRIEIEQSEIDELRKDGFEAHAKALEKLRDLQIVNTGVQPEAIDKVVEERISGFKQQFESRFLKRVHPDWESYQEHPDFAAWVQAQPADYQAQLAKASNEWNSDFIADAMTKAKEAAKKKAASTTTRRPQPNRETVLEAAIQPRGTGRADQRSARSSAFEEGWAEEG